MPATHLGSNRILDTGVVVVSQSRTVTLPIAEYGPLKLAFEPAEEGSWSLEAATHTLTINGGTTNVLGVFITDMEIAKDPSNGRAIYLNLNIGGSNSGADAVVSYTVHAS